jgi:hypothetical protein
MKEMLGTTAILAIMAALAAPAAADPIEVRAECKTESTDSQGRRSACESKRSCHTLPVGFALDEDSLQVVCESCNGTERKRNRCTVSFDDYVELIAGKPFDVPRTVCVVARARSKEGYNAGAGNSHCVATIDRVALQ